MKSKKELQDLSKDIFKHNPSAESILATSDGQFFLPNKKNAAEFHAKKAGGKTPLRIYHFDKDGKDVIEEEKGAEEVKSENTPAVKLSAEERIAKIKEMKTVEEVKEALKEEKAKTVKAAGFDRIESLEVFDRINSIATMTTVEEVEKALEGEKTEEVLAAGEQKIKDLKAAE